MRVRISGFVVALIGFALIAATTLAADETQKGVKGGKKKESAGEKVELKDVPAAVTDAAKKEAPSANFTAAEKHSAKKLGTVYSLEGKEGKYQVALMISSSGELLRVKKSVEHRGKKKSK